MIVRRYSPTSSDLVGLPAEAVLALEAICRDLRDIPRVCLLDRTELLHWLNRMARRIDSAAAIRVPRPEPTSSKTTAKALAASAPRLISTRKGRTIRVESRG